MSRCDPRGRQLCWGAVFYDSVGGCCSMRHVECVCAGRCRAALQRGCCIAAVTSGKWCSPARNRYQSGFPGGSAFSGAFTSAKFAPPTWAMQGLNVSFQQSRADLWWKLVPVSQNPVDVPKLNRDSALTVRESHDNNKKLLSKHHF